MYEVSDTCGNLRDNEADPRSAAMISCGECNEDGLLMFEDNNSVMWGPNNIAPPDIGEVGLLGWIQWHDQYGFDYSATGPNGTYDFGYFSDLSEFELVNLSLVELLTSPEFYIAPEWSLQTQLDDPNVVIVVNGGATQANGGSSTGGPVNVDDSVGDDNAGFAIAY